MIVGYARTSTLEQVAGFEAQLRELASVGAEKVFQEQVSSVAARAQLGAALDFVREGDIFAVTRLDRLARSVPHLLAITERLRSKGVTLRILNLGLDTSTATGKMLLTMLGAIGEFERSMMLERQREGIVKAKNEGKYKGRAPTARATGRASIAFSPTLPHSPTAARGAFGALLFFGAGSVREPASFLLAQALGRYGCLAAGTDGYQVAITDRKPTRATLQFPSGVLPTLFAGQLASVAPDEPCLALRHRWRGG